jgi:amino acid transporter
MLCFSTGGIIGVGWLFAALFAARLAGPASLVSWVLGGAAVTLLALAYAELGGMHPVAAGTFRYPLYAFGGLLGFAGGWFAFLGSVTAAPLEVTAALSYTAGYFHGLINPATSVLTPAGYVIATVVMLIFATVNVMGVKWLSRTNIPIVLWKLAIPALVVVVFAFTVFHPGNFTAYGGFMPFGWKGVLSAMTGGVVIFTYLGFQSAVQFGAESTNPRRDIPLAVIGSMVLVFVLYVGLQVAFIGALGPGNLASGWGHINATVPKATTAPLAGVAAALGVGWLAFLIYSDAVVSPGAIALLSLGGNARLTFALARNGYLPGFFGRLSDRGVPVYGIAFAFACGMLLLLVYAGWQPLSQLLTAAAVMTYGMAPLALGALRRMEPDRPRPYRLPIASVLAPTGFVLASEITLTTGWAVTWKLMVAVGIGLVFLAVSVIATSRERRPAMDWKGAAWLWPYLAGLTVISYLGSFAGTKTGLPDTLPILGVKGPVGALPFGWDLLVMAVFSLAIYVLAMQVRLPASRLRELIGATAVEAEPIPAAEG